MIAMALSARALSDAGLRGMASEWGGAVPRAAGKRGGVAQPVADAATGVATGEARTIEIKRRGNWIWTVR